jgi:hypothetical protein
MHRNNRALVALAVCYASIATPAFAYLDGGTASMVLQALIAGVATAMVFGRHQFSRLKSLLLRRKPEGPDAE